MANHPSAAKRNRQNVKRRARNTSLRSATRRALKLAREAISENADNKDELVKAAVAGIYRAATKNIVPANAASRTVGRLMKAAGK